MLADRVPALRGWKAAAALPFADLATNAIGRQFVYAETIAKALRRAEFDACARPATRFSFDMLGEGARTDADADRNFRRTMDAIRAMGRAVGARAAMWRERLEVSVKLSSIHPRYDAASYAQVRGELLDRLKQIAGRAAAAGIGVTVDAEVDKLARKIVAHSSAVVSMGKRFFYDQAEKGLVDAYSLASEGMACNMMLEDAGEGIDAFIQKRRPDWRGR